MDHRTSEQLEKVLALADSSHEGEAMVAVRKARELLSRGGLSFGDLARAASSNRSRPNPFSFFSGPQTHLETQIVQLKQRLNDLQADMHTEKVQTEFWRQRAGELEQNLTLAWAEVQRWRQVARETVNKLWDLGQQIKIEEFSSDRPATDEAEKERLEVRG